MEAGRKRWQIVGCLKSLRNLKAHPPVIGEVPTCPYIWCLTPNHSGLNHLKTIHIPFYVSLMISHWYPHFKHITMLAASLHVFTMDSIKKRRQSMVGGRPNAAVQAPFAFHAKVGESEGRWSKAHRWLVVWNISFFRYIGNHNPNWLVCFRGLETTNQIIRFCLKDGIIMGSLPRWCEWARWMKMV